MFEAGKPLKLLAAIKGITMDYEAWELLRLAYKPDTIGFLREGRVFRDRQKDTAALGQELGDKLLDGSCDLLILEADSGESSFEAKASLFTGLAFNELSALTDSVNLKESSFTQCDASIQRDASIQSDSLTPYENSGAANRSLPKPSFVDTVQAFSEELNGPGGVIYRSRKGFAGKAVYHVLARAFNFTLPYGSLTGVRPVKLAAALLEDGLMAAAAEEKLQNYSGMTLEKARLLVSVAEVEREHLKPAIDTVHIYAGIPFCASRCLYCSFTSYDVNRFKKLIAPYFEALYREIRLVGRLVRDKGLKVASLYVGGGTPTAVEAGELQKLLAVLAEEFVTEHTREFTVEAGRPDTINKVKLKLIKEAGANRVSINPQTMNAQTLKLIGRNHSPEDVTEKYNLSRQLGFDNINMDLIAGLPGENEEMFAHTLKEIEAMNPDSLTVHTLAIKRASRLREEKGRDYASGTEGGEVERMTEDAAKTAARMGLRPYYLYRQKNSVENLENTGYARPGCESLYNIHTMGEAQSILACGAGAVTKIVFPQENRLERFFNMKDVERYIERSPEMLEKLENFLLQM